MLLNIAYNIYRNIERSNDFESGRSYDTVEGSYEATLWRQVRQILIALDEKASREFSI
jgi:hypothetical protein